MNNIQNNIPRRLKKDEVLKRFIDIYGYLYDYSSFEYNGLNIEGIIICKIHGEFKQNPQNHITGSGCQICADITLCTATFILKLNMVHINSYEYDNTIYGKNNVTKVKIGCKIHGCFEQKPLIHLRGGGCSICNI